MDDDRHVHEQPQHGCDEDVCRPVLRRELPLHPGRPHDGAQLLWQLSEIAWGSYDGATFTRAAASGTVQTGTAPMTEVRFTGVAAGTTYYVIGGTRYVIEV